MNYLPIFLELHGRKCRVAGGGIAERKIRTSQEANAGALPREHLDAGLAAHRIDLMAIREIGAVRPGTAAGR